jgi:N-methylhydantoinase B/oxoprolinase/acetone carboxylase alpha subunit
LETEESNVRRVHLSVHDASSIDRSASSSSSFPSSVSEGGGRDGSVDSRRRANERARERESERARERDARGRRDDGVRARRRGGGERGDERDDDDERVERGTMARERRDDASRRARERARDGDG